MVEDDLDAMTAEELFGLAERLGLLIQEELTTPDVLRTRIRRASC